MENQTFSNPEKTVAELIEIAEEILNPLDNIIERTKVSSGAPFEDDVLDALVDLKKSKRAQFETLRSELKRAGCRVTALDKAIATRNGESTSRGPTQSDLLVDLAQSAELFHSADNTAYADVEVNGVRQTWSIRSKGFKQWLSHQFYKQSNSAPSSEPLQSALNLLEAQAVFNSPEREVAIRVAGLDEKIYLDLADDSWKAVEIDELGWRIVENPPVRFRRTAGMRAISPPVRGGGIELLRQFLNVKTDNDFIIAVVWLLSVLRNRGPYPVLVLSGEQGSAKSTFTTILRALVDPNTSPLRALPREERDLFISANNGHILAFDNVSVLNPWISDTLCRLATGGGFAVRQLYTDQEEILFEASRPVILNGIEDVINRPDLADRALFLNLQAIPEEERKPEADLWSSFDKYKPEILGALLDGAAKGLEKMPTTILKKLPRMADFAKWAQACETAYWPEGTFWQVYNSNLSKAVEDVIEANPVSFAIQKLMSWRTTWTGNATSLLDDLETINGDRAQKIKEWPKNSSALSNQLRRQATFLRKIGIEILFSREGKDRERIITITSSFASTDKTVNLTSLASAVSKPQKNEEVINGDKNPKGDLISPHSINEDSIKRPWELLIE